MPPAPFCLPGPHDVHNAGSVKLAEATRIRLILPGLNLSSSKQDAAGSSSRQSSKTSGDTSQPLGICTVPSTLYHMHACMLSMRSYTPCLCVCCAGAGEAAAASEKSQKKLKKLQGIASQAEQAHAGIILDDEVLQEPDTDEDGQDEAAGAAGASKAAATGSSSQLDRRKGPAGGAGGTSAQGMSSVYWPKEGPWCTTAPF